MDYKIYKQPNGLWGVFFGGKTLAQGTYRECREVVARLSMESALYTKWANDIMSKPDDLIRAIDGKRPAFYEGWPVSTAIEKTLSDNCWTEETRELLNLTKDYFLQLEKRRHLMSLPDSDWSNIVDTIKFPDKIRLIFATNSEYIFCQSTTNKKVMIREHEGQGVYIEFILSNN